MGIIARMIPILMYHQIGQPAPKGTPFRGLTVHTRDFKRQMTWLHRLGYQGLSMRDLMPYLRGEREGKVVGITFDDGYKNVFTQALPILSQLGFTSTNYFVARRLGEGNVWDYDKGIPHSDLMTVAEIRAWHAAGQEVGSHTLHHVHLPRLSYEIAAYEISQSREELQDLLGEPVTAFCYPYGDENAQIRELVAQAGYHNATTTERGLVRADEDMFGLPRSTVARSTNIVRFLQRCLTRLEDNKRRKKDAARTKQAKAK